MISGVSAVLGNEGVASAVRALLMVAAGLLAASLASRLLLRVAADRLSAHQAILIRRFAYYLVLALFIASALAELGFSLSVLLGAAGVLSVALGFASQTSASNIISGLFLIAERPFEIGDVIQVGTISGEVLSVGMLSVKLRTFDNLYVRIPNEQLIRSEVTTLTRFPIRRFDLKLRIGRTAEVGHVREVLMGVAARSPLCLDEPAPLFIFDGFGESSFDIQFCTWARREVYLDHRNALQEGIKLAFEASGIELAIPHRALQIRPPTSDAAVEADEPAPPNE